MIIAIDDTDSLEGMCTTYLAVKIIKKLEQVGAQVAGFPRLIRLNPNIPHRTRGNGAVSFRVDFGEGSIDSGKIKKIVIDTVLKYSHIDCDGTNPGIVFYDKNPEIQKNIYKICSKFYRKCLSEYVEIEDALNTAEFIGAQATGFKNRRGIIGALAALCTYLSGMEDTTYELIAYRPGENCGKERNVDIQSIINMDNSTSGRTFNNIDRGTGEILIMPKGPDPVLLGIRGETPDDVTQAFHKLKINEEIEFYTIFKTNQATDAHLIRRKISDMLPYNCAIIEGEVSAAAKTVEGGHSFFELNDGSGRIDCAAYKPSGNFRKIIRKLIPGDVVRVYGGISKYPGTFNLEKIEILNLKKSYKKINPLCKCGARMTSAGSDKGFKCRACGRRASGNDAGFVEIERDIKTGFYEVDTGAMRHLTKPLSRYSGNVF